MSHLILQNSFSKFFYHHSSSSEVIPTEEFYFLFFSHHLYPFFSLLWWSQHSILIDLFIFAFCWTSLATKFWQWLPSPKSNMKKKNNDEVEAKWVIEKGFERCNFLWRIVRHVNLSSSLVRLAAWSCLYRMFVGILVSHHGFEQQCFLGKQTCGGGSCG